MARQGRGDRLLRLCLGHRRGRDRHCAREGEATVGIDVTPGSAFAQYVTDNAPSGTFLEGFVRFTSRTQGQSDLTVPYLGFYGDWGKPAIFDQLASEGDGHVLASGIYNGRNGDLLGFNPLRKVSERTVRPQSDKYVISRSTASGAPTAIDPRTALCGPCTR